MTEAALIREAQAGSNEAMSELLRLYDRFCWKCGYRYAPSRDLIEDFAQWARYYAVQAIKLFTGSKLLGWLSPYVRRRLYQHRAQSFGCSVWVYKTKRPTRVPLHDVYAASDDVLATLIAREEQTAVNQAIRGLSATDQLILRRFDMPREETCRAVKLSRWTVAKREAAAIDDLRLSIGPR